MKNSKKHVIHARYHLNIVGVVDEMPARTLFEVLEVKTTFCLMLCLVSALQGKILGYLRWYRLAATGDDAPSIRRTRLSSQISNEIHTHGYFWFFVHTKAPAIWMPEECFAILNLGFFAYASRFPWSFDHFSYRATRFIYTSQNLRLTILICINNIAVRAGNLALHFNSSLFSWFMRLIAVGASVFSFHSRISRIRSSLTSVLWVVEHFNRSPRPDHYGTFPLMMWPVLRLRIRISIVFWCKSIDPSIIIDLGFVS